MERAASVTNQALVQGFLFGVRVANNINGNTVDIELKAIVDALSGLASGHTTIQPTGAELTMRHPKLPAETIIRANVSHDQTLAKAILDHISGGMPGNRDIQA